MKYMTITGFNPNHIFSMIDTVNFKKHQLINNCIKKTKDYKEWQVKKLKESEEAFESIFYKNGKVIY